MVQGAGAAALRGDAGHHPRPPHRRPALARSSTARRAALAGVDGAGRFYLRASDVRRRALGFFRSLRWAVSAVGRSTVGVAAARGIAVEASWSSGPRASGSLKLMSALEARGPEESRPPHLRRQR